MTGEFKGKRVLVMGLGRFGGGIGVTRWLCRQGARVSVTDLASKEELRESLAALSDCDVQYRLGSHDEADFAHCDLLVVSPAVDKTKSSFFRAARGRGLPWTSEMNLFLERCRGRLIGITGSVGKSTTTAMIGEVLRRAESAGDWRHGRVWLGGNIGKSLLDSLPDMAEKDVVVLELSSFQLEDAAVLRRSPHIALITNLRENHLDRHGTMRAYAEAKANVYRFQSPDDWLILPFEGGLEHFTDLPLHRDRLIRFGVDPVAGKARLEQRGLAPATSELCIPLQVPGLHNVQNAAAALAVSRVLGVGDEPALAALQGFAGLAHRLEFIREHRGVRYYNDSKATTPEAAMTSLAAFEGGVIMIVGGSDKGGSFAELGRALARRAKGVICIGDTRQKIHREVEAAAGASCVPRPMLAESFSQALHLARETAAAGDVVLLSPACASYDWFRNYEHRGEMFREIVNAWE